MASDIELDEGRERTPVTDGVEELRRCAADRARRHRQNPGPKHIPYNVLLWELTHHDDPETGIRDLV